MNRIYSLVLLAVLTLGHPYLSVAQEKDSVFNRVVTVERDYQPEVQQAQALAMTPTFIEYTPQLNPVVYSTYTAPLSIGYNLHALPMNETKFRAANILNGVLDGAGGYRNSHFMFGYQLQQKKNTSFGLYANHDAYWGKDAMSQSRVGMQLRYHFRHADLYFDMEGKHDYWQYNQASNMIWGAKANIGIESTGHSHVEYRIQTGYEFFYPTIWQMEHQVRSIVNFAWTNGTHKAGVNAQVQNFFYLSDSMAYAPLHAIRVEPYYEYNRKNVHIHAGVNLDMNLDKNINHMSGPIHPKFSNIDGLGFMPSPNVHFDWHTNNNVFHIYADVLGYYGTSTMNEQLAYNPFLSLTEQSTVKFTPSTSLMDVNLGFKLRPIKTLLLDIYGGYAMYSGSYYTHATIHTDGKSIDYALSQIPNYQQAKVGAKLHYHYRDIIELNASGNYYFYLASAGTIYDRPDWDAQARLDIHFTPKWSMYSENYFAGSRIAATSQGDKQIKPMISLNLGGQYIINRWLSVYLQVNDYLNRKDELFYGYHSQGIHFLVGVKYKF